VQNLGESGWKCHVGEGAGRSSARLKVFEKKSRKGRIPGLARAEHLGEETGWWNSLQKGLHATYLPRQFLVTNISIIVKRRACTLLSISSHILVQSLLWTLLVQPQPQRAVSPCPCCVGLWRLRLARSAGVQNTEPPLSCYTLYGLRPDKIWNLQLLALQHGRVTRLVQIQYPAGYPRQECIKGAACSWPRFARSRECCHIWP
jgi:hypothetical protein